MAAIAVRQSRESESGVGASMNNHGSMAGRAAAVLMLLVCLNETASAHPHIFADAKLEVATDADRKVEELRNVWRFDAVFSSSVVVDFDANRNNTLDPKELDEVAETIRGSLKDYDYFMGVTVDGKEIKVDPPEVFHADYKDGQLLLIFAVKPAEPIVLKGHLTFGVYDPTFYTAIDFATDEDLTLAGPSAGLCRRKVIRPHADTVMKDYGQALTEAFFANPDNSGVGKLFGTKLDLTC